MLKFTPATVIPGSAAAEVETAQAAMRPLAGSGAGAFTCDGARVGSRVSEMAASPALPRVLGTSAATTPARAQAHGRGCVAYQPGTAGTSTAYTSTITTSTITTSTVGTKQFSMMARINPVTPGGLGPHPAREPEPV
jgi:hypothetical protein